MTARSAAVSLACLIAAAACQEAGDPPPGAKLGGFPKSWFWHQDDTQRARHGELLGEPMPVLDLGDWQNGELDLEKDLAGKIVVVDFWATWCPPCLAAIPHNNELVEEYGERGVVLIGVCGSDRGQESMASVVESHGIRYPVARDADQRSAPAWRVMWWPTYAVVDRAGLVRAVGLRPERVDDVVEALLAEDR